ncbi:type II toxin-antitoxin system VapC family toxin [Saccharopolyspora sp. K220]|uniref:type II toxin-antitoxin system VapC family toxin n=1 Tax=Saccharopolyspora soli TaxID=2926618 RepID=UPI001F593BEC|nr:type II toxin-antitoxin system VapC family toxin [Saccharopolyspora soli]MCI2419955.1 type II toxin-antitoxin system VapC family toxin [Saccharopolyspora soli]
MADRPQLGVLDTCAYIDLELLDRAALPVQSEITAVSMAELHQGVAMAKDPTVRAARMEKLGAAIVEFDPLPFDGEASARYGTLVSLALVANRNPRPRRMDLMIAAIASSRGLPLFTRNVDDFKGLASMVTVHAV